MDGIIIQQNKESNFFEHHQLKSNRFNEEFLMDHIWIIFISFFFINFFHSLEMLQLVVI